MERSPGTDDASTPPEAVQGAAPGRDVVAGIGARARLDTHTRVTGAVTGGHGPVRRSVPAAVAAAHGSGTDISIAKYRRWVSRWAPENAAALCKARAVGVADGGGDYGVLGGSGCRVNTNAGSDWEIST